MPQAPAGSIAALHDNNVLVPMMKPAVNTAVETPRE